MFRHHRLFITGIAFALALAAVAPSAASARYAQDPPPAASQPQAQPAVDLRSPDARDAANRAVRAIQGQGLNHATPRIPPYARSTPKRFE